MSSKHQPGLFQKTTEKAWVLSQEPHFENRRDIQFAENEYKNSQNWPVMVAVCKTLYQI